MTISLKGSTREKGLEAAELRAEGLVPGVVYGGDRTETASFAVPYNELEKAYQEAGSSTLIDFTLEGESEMVKVVVQDVQFDPVKDTITHIDLKQIKMGETMQVSVELIFAGESPAVKTGGTLVKGMQSINVECLPKDLISSLDVDLTKLATYDDSIKASELGLPESITLLEDPNTMIATVSAPLSEEQLAAMEETTEASVEDVAVEEKGKKEDGEEGDAKAEAPAEKKAE